MGLTKKSHAKMPAVNWVSSSLCLQVGWSPSSRWQVGNRKGLKISGWKKKEQENLPFGSARSRYFHPVAQLAVQETETGGQERYGDLPTMFLRSGSFLICHVYMHHGCKNDG